MLEAYLDKDAYLRMNDVDKENWERQRDEKIKKRNMYMTPLEYITKKNMSDKEKVKFERNVESANKKYNKKFSEDIEMYIEKKY
jgi:hypothetical protein